MSNLETTSLPALDDTRSWIQLAQRRAIVRLRRDGRLATLVSWGTGSPDGAAGTSSRARVEGANGVTRFTVAKTDIIEVVQ